MTNLASPSDGKLFMNSLCSGADLSTLPFTTEYFAITQFSRCSLQSPISPALSDPYIVIESTSKPPGSFVVVPSWYFRNH